MRELYTRIEKLEKQWVDHLSEHCIASIEHIKQLERETKQCEEELEALRQMRLSSTRFVKATALLTIVAVVVILVIL